MAPRSTKATCLNTRQRQCEVLSLSEHLIESTDHWFYVIRHKPKRYPILTWDRSDHVRRIRTLLSNRWPIDERLSSLVTNGNCFALVPTRWPGETSCRYSKSQQSISREKDILRMDDGRRGATRRISNEPVLCLTFSFVSFSNWKTSWPRLVTRRKQTSDDTEDSIVECTWYALNRSCDENHEEDRGEKAWNHWTVVWAHQRRICKSDEFLCIWKRQKHIFGGPSTRRIFNPWTDICVQREGRERERKRRM